VATNASATGAHAVNTLPALASSFRLSLRSSPPPMLAVGAVSALAASD